MDKYLYEFKWLKNHDIVVVNKNYSNLILDFFSLRYIIQLHFELLIVFQNTWADCNFFFFFFWARRPSLFGLQTTVLNSEDDLTKELSEGHGFDDVAKQLGLSLGLYEIKCSDEQAAELVNSENSLN